MRTSRIDRIVNRGAAALPWRALGALTLALFLALSWTGCRQDPAVKPGAAVDPTGTYALLSVDGKPVPCTLQHEGMSPTIKAGTFQINADGTCSSVIQFTIPSGGENRREVKATYTRQGSKLTMKWEGAGMTEGTVDGAAFTMNNEGMIFAYRK